MTAHEVYITKERADLVTSVRPIRELELWEAAIIIALGNLAAQTDTRADAVPERRDVPLKRKPPGHC
jgi:hypothetical protein